MGWGDVTHDITITLHAQSEAEDTSSQLDTSSIFEQRPPTRRRRCCHQCSCYVVASAIDAAPCKHASRAEYTILDNAVRISA